MKQGSMLDSARKILTAAGAEMRFADLWAKVKEELDITPEEEGDRISHFYTDLSMSGEFVVLGENTWDLRARHTYDKTHIDVTEVYSEVNETGGDAADEEEEKEYNQSVQGSIEQEEEDSEDEDEEGGSKPKEDAADLLGIKNDSF